MNSSIKYNTSLPIYSRKDEIVRLIRTQQVIIVAGTTGSGKTTQLPLMCLDAGRGDSGVIAVTQPRRIAATSIANRVAGELSCAVGTFVGYKTRFESQESASTIIRFMTDGVLLSEISFDRMLHRYDTIMIDEVHERSLNIDFLLGYLRTILTRRKDLRLIISSATADTGLFSKVFGNATVIDVEGRLFPVETVYEPVAQNSGEGDYLDGALKAIQSLIDINEQGDVLVFLPTEWDIMELSRALTGMRLPNVQVLPLFARLPKKQQDLIFRSSGKQKIILASPVAETSITIPNIRFVIDTGLARTKRFTPHTRVTCLPIENISRASADQRKGRCGRVQEGMCIRLYSEADYESREAFTLPEILRSNLSDVILKMALLRLGPVEKFPFIEAPLGRAIADGYAHLRELGALSPDNQLTPIGKKMASLSIDCHVARMIIAAVHENALREILIIASGISVMEPRQRPPGKEKEADAMHARFTDPLSDFLFYLKAWDIFHEEFSRTRSKTQLRRFCEQHFLSFSRMNEWQDLHNQLSHQVKSLGFTVDPHSHAEYPAIHRAIVAGLISAIAQKQEDGSYRSARGRVLRLFPGSSLFKKGPAWIVCNEMVETSALFARGNASIDPVWIEELAPHLCKHHYGEPFFDELSGSVKASHRVTFFGFTLKENGFVHFGRINPEASTEVFIREALVGQRLQSKFGFFTKNQKLRETIKHDEAKLRTSGILVDDDYIFTFYTSRLTGVYSAQELTRCIREHGGDSFLCMSENDLLAQPLPKSLKDFPDSVFLGGLRFPLVYRCAPGEEDDGANLYIPEAALPFISPAILNWMVPGMRIDQVSWIIKACPKTIRTKCTPVEGIANTIASNLYFSGIGFVAAVCKEIAALIGSEVSIQDQKSLSLPDFLSVHCMVVDDKEFDKLTLDKFAASPQRATLEAIHQWLKSFSTWNKLNRIRWDFGDLDSRIAFFESKEGFPIYGYPALKANDQTVDCILCSSTAAAKKLHARGLTRLLELTVLDDISLFEHEIKTLGKGKLIFASLKDLEPIRINCFRMVKQAALDISGSSCRNQKQFNELSAQSKNKIQVARRTIGTTLESISTEVLNCHEHLRKKRGNLLNAKQVGIHDDLTAAFVRYKNVLVSNDSFLELLFQLPRYLTAFSLRISRAFSEPLKYEERMGKIRFWELKLASLLQISKKAPIENNRINSLLIMIEEFKVSLFAQQEVKTLFPISEKRLDDAFKEFSI